MAGFTFMLFALLKFKPTGDGLFWLVSIFPLVPVVVGALNLWVFAAHWKKKKTCTLSGAALPIVFLVGIVVTGFR